METEEENARKERITINDETPTSVHRLPSRLWPLNELHRATSQVSKRSKSWRLKVSKAGAAPSSGCQHLVFQACRLEVRKHYRPSTKTQE
jgi:hypothetical protein